MIHLRKPSLSDSVSSAESTSTLRSAQSSPGRRTPTLDFDPLSMHPTYSPPPPPARLSERPFILSHDSHDSGVDTDEVLEHYFRAQDDCKTDSMLSPPTDSPTPMAHPQPRSADEGGDYFLYKLRLVELQEQQRQAAIEAMTSATTTSTTTTTTNTACQSRWSMSTVDVEESAFDSDSDDDETDGTDDTDDTDTYEYDEEPVLEMAVRAERPARHAASWQNFSYKRDLAPASPRRPPMKTMDSVEDFIKRGGWKRRGIIFQADDTRAESSMF
jgi:hypothetical protein